LKIDIHNHAVPNQALELLRSDSVFRTTVTEDRVSGGNHVSFPRFLAFSDPAVKLAELETNGVEGAVISVAPPLFFYDVELEAGEAMANACNEGMAELCSHSPDRLHWMAHVPMRSPERAAELLAEQKQVGAVGVEVATSIAGSRLDEPEFEVFWTAAERLGLPVMIHPAYNEPHSALQKFYLQNVIGNMLETSLTAERLICAGVFDRHPNLIVVLVHSGGFFPYQAGRLRHARSVRKELEGTPEDPWSYVGQLRFDTITHDQQALAYLVSRVGAANMLLGTDLPFDMATLNPMDSLTAAVGEDTARQVAEENPVSLFKLSA